MNDTAVLEKIELLTRTVQRLESRVEELETREDLWDLETAIVHNGNQPLVPWDQAKAMLDLGLEDKLLIGEVGTMEQSVQAMATADKVIRP